MLMRNCVFFLVILHQLISYLVGRANIERHHTLGRNSFTCIISVTSWSTSALKTVTNGCCLSD